MAGVLPFVGVVAPIAEGADLAAVVPRLAQRPADDGADDLVRERGLDNRVMVNRTMCLKHCSRGAVLAIQPDNVWYAAVTPDDLAEICVTHLEQGQTVERLLMPDIPWE